MFKLLPTATEAEVSRVTHNAFISARHLTSPISATVAVVVVKRAHDLSILRGLPLSSINRYFCVAIRIGTPGANLLAAFQVSLIPCQHHVLTATTSSCSSASSAGSSGRHVERLLPQIIGRVAVIAGHEEVLGQTAILVQRGKSTRLTCLGQLSF